MEAPPALSVDDLSVAYGAIRALNGVTLTVRAGQTVAVLGANGAGKTSLLNAISGLAPVAAGDIRLGEESVLRLRPDRRVAKGICQVPEGREMLGLLTVRENLLLASDYVGSRDGREQRMEDVHRLFPRLEERSGQRAGTLSGGEQQMVAIGRALMGDPQVLMLDEPSLGLAPKTSAEIFRRLTDLMQLRRDEGRPLAMLLVEQNARQALRIAEYVYVFQRGAVVRAGPASELTDGDEMARAYLGG